MGLRNWLQTRAENKAIKATEMLFKGSQIPFGQLVQDFPSASLLFGNQTYHIISTEGYILNYVIHKVIDDISRMASNVPLTIEGSPKVEALMMMPSPNTSYKKWMKRTIAEKYLDGNAFAEIIKIGSSITQLNQFRPDRVNVVTGEFLGRCDALIGYEHHCGGSKRFPVDPETGLVEMLHTKFYNPLDVNRGLSPVRAAFMSLIQNNEISRIHTATLKNDGAPVGFIGMKQPSKDTFQPAPDNEKMIEIREHMNDVLSGTKNRGKWAIFNWMFEFVRLGQTGSEMNWNENKQISAREMAIALGYPPILLGFAEGSTFNNLKEATSWLMLNTVLPILEEVLDDMKMAIFMHTGEQPIIEPNRELILAIQELIREKRAAAREDKLAGIITLEEARIEGGYEPTPKGTLFVPTNSLPIGVSGTDFTPTE